MSRSPRSRKSFREWTMVDSRGEVMSGDNRSDSSHSSNEAVCLPVTTTEATLVPLLPEQKVETELCELHGTEDCDICPGNAGEMQVNHQPFEISLGSTDDHATDVRILDRYGGLGACCKELMQTEGNANCGEESEDEKEVEKEVDNSFPLSMPYDVISCPKFPGEMAERTSRETNDHSDSDSDFVQIDEDNVDLEAELEQGRNDTPNRSPSIAEGFNFLGPPDGGVRDVLHGNDDIRGVRRENISEEEMDDDEDDYDVNEDTESSTEDIGDDRIESDQSEVGSVNALTDVGDLSTFADIGDLPLEAGNVARNYRHRPNNRLSSVLNVVLIVVTILTMGISIGLIMATDQEMEEWHNAYLVQAKKVSSLEWTLRDMDQVMHESKDKANAYDSVLKSFSKAAKPNDNSIKFFSNFAGIVNKLDSCTREQGSLSTVNCHALILPDVWQSLSIFKQVTQAGHEDSIRHFTFEGHEQEMEDNSEVFLRQKQSCDRRQELQEMQQSLVREQERALHWQNLYLLERRQREWERDHEDFEDRRERAQWEKEDEEEDRRERERWEREEAENDRQERLQWEKEEAENDRQERLQWEKEEAENDRQERLQWEKEEAENDKQERLQWEKEEAENDRQERLQWEKEEQEEDKRDRERWEKERAEMDSLECLKKLMSTNLTLLRHQVTAWNTSAFDDFVNMSMLMSGITELKQSVISSVQQIWVEAEEALNKMGQDVKKGKKPYLDTSIMADYLNQALAMLTAQFDDVVNLNMDIPSGKVNPDSDSIHKGHFNKEHIIGHHKRFGERSTREEGASVWTWNKAIGKMFKKTSKSLRKFVRTLATSWTTVKGVLEKKASNFIPSRKPAREESTDPLPSWLPGKACRSVWSYEYEFRNNRYPMVEIGSPCLWDVRDGLSKLLLKEPCTLTNHYSLGCNVNASAIWRLKKDLKHVLEADELKRALEGNENVGNVKMSLIEAREMLLLFKKFWRSWGKSELLLKSDKKWAFCQLRYWSHCVDDVQDDMTVQHGKSCDRLVSLTVVLEEIENRKIKPKNWKKEHAEDIVDNNDDENLMENQEDILDNDDDENLMENQEDILDNDDDEKDLMEENLDHGSKSFIIYDDEVDDRVNKDEIDDDKDVRDSKMVDDIHDEKWSFIVPPPGLEKKRNCSDGDERSGMEGMEQNVWYLKRAEDRMKMRRAQEKAMWFFDLSEHRDEMRKGLEIKSAQWLFDLSEHRDEMRKGLEMKSAQWLFDQAENRESLRKKDQLSDWLFDRAQHRREEFAKKWSSDEFERWQGNERQMIKMRDLSESDWLLQNEGHYQTIGKILRKQHPQKFGKMLRKQHPQKFGKMLRKQHHQKFGKILRKQHHQKFGKRLHKQHQHQKRKL